MDWAHPAAGFLFFQGRLASEFEGRIVRLRQDVRDLDIEEMAVDRIGAVQRLVKKFALDPVRLQGEREFIGDPSGEMTMQLPFDGSSVLLHRRPPGIDVPAPAGRVKEVVAIEDGVRHRRGWIMMPVPEPVKLAPDELVSWANSGETTVLTFIGLANAALAEFLPSLRTTALEAIDRRLQRVGGQRPA
jgi:hypothetical protein